MDKEEKSFFDGHFQFVVVWRVRRVHGACVFFVQEIEVFVQGVCVFSACWVIECLCNGVSVECVCGRLCVFVFFQ